MNNTRNPSSMKGAVSSVSSKSAWSTVVPSSKSSSIASKKYKNAADTSILVSKAFALKGIMVTLPLPNVERKAVLDVFKFILDNMGKALANCLELKNKARAVGNVNAEKAMAQSLYAIQKINKEIEIQRRAWFVALKNPRRRTVMLPNVPVTPLGSYAMSNRLMYKKNITAQKLTPRVRKQLDTLGQMFLRTRNSLAPNPTENYIQAVASVKSLNALRALEIKAFSNGVNHNTIRKIAKTKELQFLKTAPQRNQVFAKAPPPPLPQRVTFMNRARAGWTKAHTNWTVKSLLPKIRRPGFML